jgi:phosphatidate phosphatase APP1
VEYEGSFELGEFLKEHISDYDHHEITFQVRDTQGSPIPFGLLRMDWTETGARLSFQTDDQGILTMHFEEDILEQEVMISVDTKPMGQEVMKTQDYDSSTQRVPDARIQVTW